MQRHYPQPISDDSHLPRCLKNGEYLAFFQLLHNIICSPIATVEVNRLPDLEIYGIGSSHRKENPPDADFLIPNLKGYAACIINYFQKHSDFFNENKNSVDFLQKRGVLSASYFSAPHPVIWIISILCCYDIKIDAAYTKDRRHVIKLSNANIKIDFVLQDEPWRHHALHSDFSMNTRYFCVRTWKIMYEFSNAWQDIENKKLVFVHDVQAMLSSDITIFFRAIRFISSEDLILHDDDIAAISAFLEKNYHAILSLNRDRLAREKELLFCLGYAEKSVGFLLHTGWMKYLYDNTLIFTEDVHFLLKQTALFSDLIYKKQELTSESERFVIDALKQASLDENIQKKLLLCLFDYVVYSEFSHKKVLSFSKYSICNPINPIVFNALRERIALIDPIFKNFLQELLKRRSDSVMTIESDGDNGHTTDESSMRSSVSTPVYISRRNSEEPVAESGKPAEAAEIHHENIDDESGAEEESGATDIAQKKKKKRKKNKKKNNVSVAHPGSAYIQALMKLHQGQYEHAVAALRLLCQEEGFLFLLKKLLILWQKEIESMDYQADKFPEKLLKMAVLHYVFDMYQECINDYKMFIFLRFDRDLEISYNSSNSPDISYLLFIVHLSLTALSRMEEAKNCFLEITLNKKISSVVKAKLKPATQDLIKEDFAQRVNKTNVMVDEYVSQADACVSLGLCFMAISLYELVFESTKTRRSGRADVAEQLLLCYIQFNWCEKAVSTLEYLNTWDDFKFVNNKQHRRILERLQYNINASSEETVIARVVKQRLMGRYCIQVGLYTSAIEFFFQAMSYVAALEMSTEEKAKLNMELHQRLAITYYILAGKFDDDLTHLLEKKQYTEQVQIHYRSCKNTLMGSKIPAEVELRKTISQELEKCKAEIDRLEKLIKSNQAYFRSSQNSVKAKKIHNSGNDMCRLNVSK